MSDSTQRQLALPELSDSEMLDRIIACILSSPNGLEKIDRLRDEIAKQPMVVPACKKRDACLTRQVRAQLVKSCEDLVAEFGNQPFKKSVLNHWYQKTFAIKEEDKTFIGTKQIPRWEEALSNAIENNKCPVIRKVGHDRYIVVPLAR